MAMRRTLIAGVDDGAAGGFTLLEVICVLAIVGILAYILLPATPSGTSQPRLQAYAIQVASVLTADRNAAIRLRHPVVTSIDALARSIHSGTTGEMIRLPNDVNFAANLAARCNGQPTSSAIIFFASGLSCGGVLSFLQAGIGYEVRVNWLTGGVEIVRHRTL
jgi:general secretion pathway protein H